MPILKFSGVETIEVENYSKLVNEIADLIVAAPENIIFICENSNVFPKTGKQAPIYVTVEWMARPDKQQLLVNHIVSYFKNKGTKVGIFFTDINDKWYMNGKKVN